MIPVADTLELVRRRQLNGTYSPPTSDEDSDDGPSNSRTIKQGAKARSRKTPARTGSVQSSLDDDPCGVRRKRTFFRSQGEQQARLAKQAGLTVPLVNGLLGDVTPEIILNGGVGIAEGLLSRAGSPASVV